MKKILVLLSAIVALQANAQSSISLINVASNSNIAPNGIIQLTVNPYANKKIDIDIKNTSTNTYSYTVTRYDVLLNVDAASSTTATAYYCFGGACYGAMTIVSPPLILRGGKKASDTTLVDPNAAYYILTADLDEAGVKGKSIVKYTFKNMSVAADSVQIILSYNGALTGLAQIEKEISSFDVFPNPAHETMDLKITSNKNMATKAVVVNALGAVVIEKDVQLSEGKNAVHFDLADLPAGVYFARVGNGSAISTKKFVVN